MKDDPTLQTAHTPPQTEDERWVDNVRHMIEGILGMPPNQAAKVVAVSYTLLPRSARERIESFLSTPPTSQMGLLEDLVKAVRDFVNKERVGTTKAELRLEHALELVEAKQKSPEAETSPIRRTSNTRAHTELAQAAQQLLEILDEEEMKAALKDAHGVSRRGRLRKAVTQRNALVGTSLSNATCTCKHNFAHDKGCPFWPNVR